METLLEQRKNYLAKLLNYLSEYFDIQSDLILTSNAEEYVNTRYILIYFLCSKFSDKEVSKITGLTKSGVNTIKNKFKTKTFLEELYKSIYYTLITL